MLLPLSLQPKQSAAGFAGLHNALSASHFVQCVTSRSERQDDAFPAILQRSILPTKDHRIQAAKRLHFEEVPTISIQHLLESQRRAFMIADNRLAEQATWDATLPAEQLRELFDVELNFDLEAIGFEVGEVDVLIEGAGPEIKDNSDPPDDWPESTLNPVTQEGDLWLLGPHRVYSGNSLNADSHSALIDSRHALLCGRSTTPLDFRA